MWPLPLLPQQQLRQPQRLRLRHQQHLQPPLLRQQLLQRLAQQVVLPAVQLQAVPPQVAQQVQVPGLVPGLAQERERLLELVHPQADQQAAHPRAVHHRAVRVRELREISQQMTVAKKKRRQTMEASAVYSRGVVR